MTLDAKLAATSLGAREPMLAQLRLAWWRDRLGEAAVANPRGEPLLAALADWGEHRAGLVALVDGWEAQIGDGAPAKDAALALASGRGAAAAALARLLGARPEPARTVASAWGDNDYARLVGGVAPRVPLPYLPRALRPLLVLEALSCAQASPFARLTRATRKGLFGR